MSHPNPLLDGLDDQQAAAASHLLGRAIVIAGAGAGKTFTLVKRLANLLSNGVDPETILLTSFTRTAAKEIIDRARRFHPLADRVNAGTFHSVGVRIAREYHEALRMHPNFTVLDQHDCGDFMRSAIARAGGDGFPMTHERMVKIVSYSRNTGKPYEEVMRRPQNMEFRSHLPAVIEVAKEYKMLKWRQQVVDFDDILAFWAYLSQHAEIGAELRNRFRHVMLDEYQDNNHLQSIIVHGLGDLCAGSLMAVGDPAQSIYGFRGASPSTMYAFKKRWPDASVYLIERNYRSSHEIVATADTIDRNMSDRFERRLVSARGPSGVMPLLTNGQDQSDCTGHLVSLIHDKWREEGIPLSEQAILVRSTNRARRIELELESMGIPYRFVGGIKIKEAAHVKDMLAALKFVINPGDQMSLVRLLTGFKGVGDKTVDAVVSRVYGEDASSGPQIGQSMDEVLPILEEAIAAEKRAKPLVVVPEVLRKVEAQRDRPNQALIDVVVGLQDMLAHVYKDSWEWRRKELAFFMDLAKEYSSIDDFLQTVTLDASHDKESDNPDETPDVLTVSTIHGAKGLEWRCVYIPEFVEKHIPSVSAKTKEELDDELRLFYVAVTRARDELHFLKPLNLVHENSQYASTVSQYETMVSSHLQRFNRVEPSRRVQSSRPAYEIDEYPADEPMGGPPAGPSSFTSFASFGGPSRR